MKNAARGGLKLLFGLMLCGVAMVAQETNAAKTEAKAEDDSLLTWKWVNFGLLAVGLGYLLGKSLPPFFKARTNEIQKDILDAQQTRKEAEARAANVFLNLICARSEEHTS